jgi:poly-gamma-glutamate synthesis protein (capsule biosynthesis protein)
VDIVHGHSSHHFKGIEVHRGRPILYGCGDFLNDYEGISGRQEYRSDLALLYFPVIDISTGKLVRLTLSPMRIQRFRLNRPAVDDVVWVRDTLNREGERFGTRVEVGPAGDLELRWS